MTKKAPKKPKRVGMELDSSKSSQLVGHPDSINLSVADQAAFAKALMDPPPLNEAMVRAMQRRSELLAKGGEPGHAADEFILPEMVTPKRSAGKTLAQHVSEGRKQSCSWPQVATIEAALNLLSRPRIRNQALKSLRELAAVAEYQGLRIMQLSSLIVTDERGDPISQENYEDLQARATAQTLTFQGIREIIEALCPVRRVAPCERHTEEGIRLLQRDPKRIPYILEAVRRVWESEPDFRLGQLIVMAAQARTEILFLEEADLLEGLIRLDRLWNSEGKFEHHHRSTAKKGQRNRRLATDEDHPGKGNPITKGKADMAQAVWTDREMRRVAGGLEEIARATRWHLEDPADPLKTDRLKNAMQDAFFVLSTAGEGQS